jgi:copper homeostasis protein
MASPILEVIVCSEADAMAAADGGADRLEVISNYAVGGLTPPVELVRRLTASIPLPLRVMLRHSESFVVSDQREMEELCAAASTFADLGVDGLVLGFLRHTSQGKRIDRRLPERVLLCAPGVKATFHRAFEELHDPLAGIGELKRHPQVDRILTSAGGGSEAEQTVRLVSLRRAASPELQLVIGGGTDADTICRLRPLGISEFHVGTAVREQRQTDGAVLADRVRAMVELVKRRLD